MVYASPNSAWIVEVADWQTRATPRLGQSFTRWVRSPLKLRDDERAELITGHPDGFAHYGFWLSLLDIAKSCPHPGWLTQRNGTPFDVPSLAEATKFPVDDATEATKRLVHMGWLVLHPLARNCPTHPINTEDV